MTVSELKNLLNRYKLKPNKTFGQHFLLDDSVLDSMVEAADVKSTDIVLEVGPGIGNLTSKLVAVAGNVLAVEKDTSLEFLLSDITNKHKNLSVEYADIMRFNFTQALKTLKVAHKLKPGRLRYKVVANIPYYVTGKLLQLFLRAQEKPESITVLVQAEVAKNMVAEHGSMNLLGLSVQLIGKPKFVLPVPASSFYPAPKVDSAIVHINIPEKPLFANVDEGFLFRVAKACFSGKRKQIHNSLASGFRLSKLETDKILEQAHIAPSIRPQELSVEDFVRLAKIYNELVNHS